jgi:hypothetical protein
LKWAPTPLPINNPHPFVLLENTILGQGSPSGIPSLHSLLFNYEVSICGVSIFGNTSKYVHVLKN